MDMTGADVTRFWEKVEKLSIDECWKWRASRLKNGGYGAFRLNGKTVRAHRVAFFLANTTLDSSLEVLHTCSNPCCCNPAHLIQDTHQANLKQAGQEGKMVRYSGPNSKTQLNEEQLYDILTSKASARALGRKYSIDHKTIRSIQKGYTLCQTSKTSQA